MGIVNVTPDSFFEAARTQATTEAVERARGLFAAGVDIVDVGGESTRPGAVSVDEEEEVRRVVPVLLELHGAGTLSIDTQKVRVAEQSVEAGASIINDVSSTLMNVAGRLHVGYVAMHRKGTSATMQDNPTYDDVVDEVLNFLRDAAQRSRDAGVEALWLDPGIGFGKTLAHNVALLAATDRIAALAKEFDAGVLIGTSRKRFLGEIGTAFLDVDERLEGSIASEAWAFLYGADMVRVHDGEAAVQLRELLTRRVAEVVS
jgi:dihydropteroate synthase